MRSTVLVLSALSLVTSVACVKDDDRRASATTLTNATVRTGHTADNAGYIDNGGRTSDETAPTELSGARPTDNAGRPPAESPRTAPLPIAPAAPLKTDTSFDDRSQRISRAICDRETYCNRVGEGRTFRSQEECTVQFNPTAHGFVEAASCQKGFDETQLASCLAAVRSLSCSGEKQTLQNLPPCRSICNP